MSDSEVTNEAVAAWERLVKEHIRPSRLMAIAVGLDRQTGEESAHLLNCPRCTHYYNAYQMYHLDTKAPT
jgi:hypothetical protein